jgi:RNA recognition motif-containing protein
MAKNIYVGNLAWETTADDLLALFQDAAPERKLALREKSS